MTEKRALKQRSIAKTWPKLDCREKEAGRNKTKRRTDGKKNFERVWLQQEVLLFQCTTIFKINVPQINGPEPHRAYENKT